MDKFVRFSLTQGKITATLSVKKHHVYRLPDGSNLFHVLLQNDMEIIVVGSLSRRNGDWCEQTVHFFDKALDISYRGSFDLVFRVFDSGRDHYVFYIDAVNRGSKESFGAMKLGFDRVIYEGEVLETAWSKKLYTKALLLRG